MFLMTGTLEASLPCLQVRDIYFNFCFVYINKNYVKNLLKSSWFGRTWCTLDKCFRRLFLFLKMLLHTGQKNGPRSSPYVFFMWTTRLPLLENSRWQCGHFTPGNFPVKQSMLKTHDPNYNSYTSLISKYLISRQTFIIPRR